MTRRIASVFFALVLLLSMLPVTAFASGDTTPPVLISYTINKTSFTMDDQIIFNPNLMFVLVI